MKLATLRNGTRNGKLVIVSRDLRSCIDAPVATLQLALDGWSDFNPVMQRISDDLNAGKSLGAMPFDPKSAMAPLPRAYQFLDGSFYLPHTELMSKWRNMPVPSVFFQEPMVYQGCSDPLLGACDDMVAGPDEWGLDFEAEVALVMKDTPAGTTREQAPDCVALVMLCNDISLRGLIPHELSKEFGFVQSKPPSAFSPVAVTPDELGAAWDGNLLHRPILATYNSADFGCANAGKDAQFGFRDLIAHVTKTRALGAGAILGSGTISNSDRTTGSSCLAERRAIETIEHGAPKSPWMKAGDRIEIEMLDDEGRSIFGKIDQRVVKAM
jgi:fumarylacetoacetate (FAA) hydrolase